MNGIFYCIKLLQKQLPRKTTYCHPNLYHPTQQKKSTSNLSQFIPNYPSSCLDIKDIIPPSRLSIFRSSLDSLSSRRQLTRHRPWAMFSWEQDITRPHINPIITSSPPSVMIRPRQHCPNPCLDTSTSLICNRSNSHPLYQCIYLSVCLLEHVADFLFQKLRQ